jgi:hypothetical protein
MTTEIEQFVNSGLAAQKAVDQITKPKPVINEPTKTLLFLAAHIRCLREDMGLDYEDTEDGQRVGFKAGFARPWLKVRERDGTLSFDPDVYAKTLECGSSGMVLCRKFILNVWNTSYAKEKGWTFDLFRAVRVLDSGNIDGICYVLKSTPWP